MAGQRQMSSQGELLLEMQRFASDFEQTIQAIYGMSIEISLGSYREDKAKATVELAASASAKLDNLIKRYLQRPILDADAQTLFMTLASSQRPQLDAAMAALKDAVSTPPNDVSDLLGHVSDNEVREIVGDVTSTLDKLKTIQPQETIEEEEEEEQPETKTSIPAEDFTSFLVLPPASVIEEEEEEESSTDSSV